MVLQRIYFVGVRVALIMAAYLEFDGACRHTIAGTGFVLLDDRSSQILGQGSDFLGFNFTSNQAEYKALIAGLRKARSMGITRISVSGDSELVVNQVLGLYRVRCETLRRYYNEVMGLLDDFSGYAIQHVPRQENEHADFLAREGMDKDYQDYTYGRVNIVATCWNFDNAWRYLLNQRIRGYWRMDFMLEVIDKNFPDVYRDVVERCYSLGNASSFDSPAAILAAY